MRTRAERLFDQQFWLWNHDVKHPSGNLLLAYGFTCECGPTVGGTLSSSAYSLSIDSQRLIRVCESGMFVSTAPAQPVGPGVYVRRLGFDGSGEGLGTRYERPIELPIHVDVNVPDREAELARVLELGAGLLQQFFGRGPRLLDIRPIAWELLQFLLGRRQWRAGEHDAADRAHIGDFRQRRCAMPAVDGTRQGTAYSGIVDRPLPAPNPRARRVGQHRRPGLAGHAALDQGRPVLGDG